MTLTCDASDLETAAAGLARLDDVLDPLAADVVAELADVVQASVRDAARRHRRTGRLERNIRQVERVDAGMASRVTVAATGLAAPIIVGGSAAHVIAPARSHALTLYGAGPASGFASRVRHPGTAPDPFYSRGLAAARSDLDRVIDRGAQRAADQLARVAEGG